MGTPGDDAAAGRLAGYRLLHPQAEICCVEGWWRAWMPAGDGGTQVTRRHLDDLLDRLGELAGPS